jgi:hypothetical protein
MFELPVVANTMRDGSSIERPFRLDGIVQSDFKLLLRVMASRSEDRTMYQQMTDYPGHSYGREESLSTDEWTSVLKLSIMWGIQSIKEKAINRVFQQGALDLLVKISIARDYGLSDELLHSLNLLAQQRRIKAEDANVLGLEYFLKILEVQERVDPASIVVRCSRCTNTSHRNTPTDLSLRQNYNYTTALQEVFQDEIKKLDIMDTNDPEKVLTTAGPVHPGEDDVFFHVGVFFLVS